MEEIVEVVKSAPKIVEEAYSDGVSNTLKEASKIGVDAAKTVRLMLFPLQFGAMAQERLAKYISGCINRIPESNRIDPSESLVLPIADKLRYHEETNPLTEVYLNLMSRAMDRERVGEAHPAFIDIISQLCPDEVLLLNQIGKSKHLLLYMLDGRIEAYSYSAIASYLESLDIPPQAKKSLKIYAFDRNSIAQPELLTTLLEHLVSLGLVNYDVNLFEREEFSVLKGFISYPKHYLQRPQLTKFGKLFFKACVKCEKFA
ncbi:Abi-alpha family protein [Vibrio penaeicida]|uniref:Abi-alpha family protein n=1 Tax=Vibrio penaeicida TaxID=104609 RepID=UPI0027343971|nr:Abi-alpha family protein [Vibrio penaeicida]MDP2575356.1 Abi-alpha family protein [Vibrio penaeicida]